MAVLSGTEECQRTYQLIGLGAQLFSRGRHFLGGRSILLNDFLELLERFVDLFGAGILFLAGRGDLLHELRRPLDIRYQFLEHFTGLP